VVSLIPPKTNLSVSGPKDDYTNQQGYKLQVFGKKQKINITLIDYNHEDITTAENETSKMYYLSRISSKGWHNPQPMWGVFTIELDFEQKAITVTWRFPRSHFFLIIGVKDILLHAFALNIPGIGQVRQRSGVQLVGGFCLQMRRHSSSDFPRK